MAPTRGSGVSRALNSADIEKAVELAGLGKLLPEESVLFGNYLQLLLKWNSKINLTAIREPENIVSRHFVECIQCARAIPALPKCPTLLDYGSGAGLPGVPIAICRPEIRVTLAESQGKKAAFLREAVRRLGLTAEVFHGRVEDLPPDSRFSVVALRSVDNMAEACRSALDRIAPNGWIALLATVSTEAGLKTTLPEVEWHRAVPMVGLAEGRLLLGQRLI